MMDMSYQQPQQPYPSYESHQWMPEYKPAFGGERLSDHQQRHDALPSAAATPAEFNSAPPLRRPSTMKVEDDYSSSEVMWQDRHHEQPQFVSRHYSQPSVPTHGPHPPYMRIDPFTASYANPQWSAIPQSGTATPTPVYHNNAEPRGQPVQYATPYNFNTLPNSAVSMSPQSSSGGWASANSSDGMDHALHSPVLEILSPTMVQRSDGIRKKNARFEIPKERNLATIDAMIATCTDDDKRKELKQQKRLLRNRQAALDSRQRKKSHTEKLEHEKRETDGKMLALEEHNFQLQERLEFEGQAAQRQREQYELQIRQLMHDREEIIRVKTLEAAECRRQVNFLREYIRDNHIDRPSHSDDYDQGSDLNNFTSNFGDFTVDDDFETELSIFHNSEFTDAEPENVQREATPKPSAAVSKKVETDFSWNTFYMCLLFGAVVVSAGGSLSKLASTPTDMSLPKVSDEYRADAENLLKAVMTSNPQSALEMIPARSGTAPAATVTAFASSHLTTVSSSGKQSESSLEALTGPTREQKLQQLFAMTPDTYNHITNPLGNLIDNHADVDLADTPKQTRLEAYMASIHNKKDEIERAVYDKYTHQSVLADHVPEQAMADFRAFVQEANAHESK